MNKDLIKKFELAEKLFADKKFEKSIIEFKEILNSDANFIPALYNIGLSYEFLNQLKEAENNYFKCYSLKPDEILFMNNLSTVYLKQRKFEKALPLLKKSIKIKEKQLIIIHHTVMCLIDLDKREEAEKFASEKLKSFPNDSELNKLHGRNLMNLNKHKQGLEFMKKSTGFIEFQGNELNIITN